jgi:hypothetical protein
MRSLATLAATFVASALVLVACGGDQQTMTSPTAAPTGGPSFAGINSHNSYTFGLTCSGGVGASTGAQVTVIVSSTVSGRLAPLQCGGADPGITGFKSFDYQITVTNAADQPVAACSNTKPIHGATSITCTNGVYSATLTVTAG